MYVQYCAKEMQTKFAEISEITRISAIKLRTFASIVLMSARFKWQYLNKLLLLLANLPIYVLETRTKIFETN